MTAAIKAARVALAAAAINAARAALAAAGQRRDAAELALAAEKKLVSEARHSLGAALLARDAAMPRCILRTRKQCSRDHNDREVCIVKKTAKSVFIRTFGVDNDVGQQYRQDKFGRWRPYPAPSGMWDDACELIFEDGAS